MKSRLNSLNTELERIMDEHIATSTTNTINTTSATTDPNKEIYDEFIKMEKIEEDFRLGLSFIKLNKQQIKKKKKLGSIVAKNKEQFDKYLIEIKKESRKFEIEKQIEDIKFSIENACERLMKILIKFGYVDFDKMPKISSREKPNIADITFDCLTPKAIIASGINDCNPLILTEIITRNILDDLSEIEIVALLGIFIDDSRNSGKEEKQLCDVKCSAKVFNKIKELNKIIGDYVEEEKINYVEWHLMGFWDISYDFVDICYYWAEGKSVVEILGMVEVYEGNFVKNMLKVVNIVRNMIDIYKMTGKYELLPKFERLEGLIMRDIVSVDSLYLEGL